MPAQKRTFVSKWKYDKVTAFERNGQNANTNLQISANSFVMYTLSDAAVKLQVLCNFWVWSGDCLLLGGNEVRVQSQFQICTLYIQLILLVP